MTNHKRQKEERAIWEKLAENYDQNVLRTFSSAYELTINAIQKNLSPQDSVLEMGCGTGIIALDIAAQAKQVIGVDLSPAMIEVAKRKAQIKQIKNVLFEVGDAYHLSYEDKSFDLVLLTNLLHVVKQPGAILAEAKRLLKSDGILITVTDCYAEPVPVGTRLKLTAQRLLKWLGLARHLHYYHKSDLRKLLKTHGFQNLEEIILHPAPVNVYLSGKPIE